jgi:hypothetical protein
MCASPADQNIPTPPLITHNMWRTGRPWQAVQCLALHLWDKDPKALFCMQNSTNCNPFHFSHALLCVEQS